MPQRSLTKRIHTIGQFVDWVDEVSFRFQDESGYMQTWFRGCGSTAHRLVPGLYRTTEGQDPWADGELSAEFSRRALPLARETPPRTDWEWYFLAQHFRAPTRLLDWTDGGLVALYFALTANRDGEEPCVWALNPFELNVRNKDVSFEGAVTAESEYADAWLPRPFRRRRLPRFPVAIDPQFASARMMVQRSHFTLHGSDTRGIEQMNGLRLGESLIRVIIDFSERTRGHYLWHLAACGITQSTLFPDLEGLTRELRQEYGLE